MYTINTMTEPAPEILRKLFLQPLQAEAATLVHAQAETRDNRAPVTLDQQSVGRLSRMDAMQQQAMAQAQDARRTARLRAIEAALKRLAGDDFGYCDACGEFIGLPRLTLDPTLTRCIGCAG